MHYSLDLINYYQKLWRSQPGRTIGVILSGSLDDGSRGLAAIHEARGPTMVLDPGTKPRGMQQDAIDFDGPINFVGTSKEIAKMIGRALNEKRLAT
jgi:two-component system chemotaxis response regulator CheB